MESTPGQTCVLVYQPILASEVAANALLLADRMS